MEQRNDLTLENIANLLYLDKNNAKFEYSNGILSLELTNNDTTTKYDRVFLHKAFPYEDPFAFISVIDVDKQEIGLIRDLNSIKEDEIPFIKDELAKVYFVPVITKILSIKERFGFSHWQIETEFGPEEISFMDTYRSIVRLSPTHIYLTDSNGNRYEIPNLDNLDKRSRKKIEIYL